MNNNIVKCPKCGADNINTNKFCESCGNVLNENGNGSVPLREINELTDEEIQKARTIGWISLVLFFLGAFLFVIPSESFREAFSPIISTIGGTSPLAGIAVMVYGRIKYPKSEFLKTVMWIMLINIICFTLFTIFVIVACVSACSQLGAMG